MLQTVFQRSRYAGCADQFGMIGASFIVCLTLYTCLKQFGSSSLRAVTSSMLTGWYELLVTSCHVFTLGIANSLQDVLHDFLDRKEVGPMLSEATNDA